MANPAPLTSVEGGLAHGKMHETWRMALAEQVDSIWSMKEVRECETEVTSQGSTMDVYNDTPQVASGNGRNGMEAITQLCDTERATGPFRDLSLTLYLFTRRLYDAALKDGVSDLFFFAREGLLLKQMFDRVQANEDKTPIRSHYLKVSRRSTFLLSLRPLDQEQFEVLFRQYRRISIAEFLKSLALEEYLLTFATELNVEPSLLAERSADLPHDPLFVRLLDLPSFAQVYEKERLARSKAFENYVGSFCNGTIPARLSVVDVGWKGSIQDNVFGWMRNLRGDAASVKGYYVGLIATGNAGPSNEKAGLLFESIGERTAGYYVFNENRSLFEVLLHANHGSAQRYIQTSANEVIVVEDSFEEGPMIEAFVKPVADCIMASFVRIADAMATLDVSEQDLLACAVKRHSRMVFRPSSSEIEWMRSLSHVENFGVFEASTFDNRRTSPSLGSRLRFSIDVFRHGQRDLGFWPWLTIEERALWGMAGVYRIIRMWQNQRTMRLHSSPTDKKAVPK
ncbi:TPA: hypothetical protein ACT5B7_000766 [Burkholderia cenocepacia]|uniref:hypothetical protein n=3 Tax=Burkholderia cenocepacia TaxID=95486 RepID=UPI000A65030A|nr:hypothetical protein [Burkholderia cenocepacia]MEB2599125.1 hypothetical protein [Burkholderia cenocepacia]RQU39754.1 hypothetical protein DF150_02360 [Burkholderia cenocepacia]CAB5101333.1 hypothetical protein IST439_01759 [Burkholderia cenocepacia]CAB5113281.1 hypothetical protein IST4129_01720 [Burkholderia cenocepacia]CAB5139584.1 hypothetical protein IST4131_01716 [Burkholderia cenocepacia]